MSSEFVGRTGHLRVYSYPLPRFTGLIGPFARNFAAGPLEDIAIPTGSGLVVPWSTIYSGASPGTGVPITPKATGLIRLVGAFAVKNNSDENQRVDIFVSAMSDVSTINLAFPLLLPSTITPVAFEVIPLVAETQDPSEALVVGTLYNFFITMSSTDDTDVLLVAQNSTLELQEVAAPTG